MSDTSRACVARPSEGSSIWCVLDAGHDGEHMGFGGPSNPWQYRWVESSDERGEQR